MNDLSSDISSNPPSSEVSDDELLAVIADFLAMGHVDNIIAMFRQEVRYYDWAGSLLEDPRFSVRLGLAVLFECLAEDRPQEVRLAIPSLAARLDAPQDWIRGEAVNLLGIIGTGEALKLVGEKLADPSPQVVEVAKDILGQYDRG